MEQALAISGIPEAAGNFRQALYKNGIMGF